MAKVQQQLAVSRKLRDEAIRLKEPYASARMTMLTTLTTLALFHPVDTSDTCKVNVTQNKQDSKRSGRYGIP